MLLDRDSVNDHDLYEYFEGILLKKCSECLTFGTRVCGLLKVRGSPFFITLYLAPCSCFGILFLK